MQKVAIDFAFICNNHCTSKLSAEFDPFESKPQTYFIATHSIGEIIQANTKLW